MKGATAEVVNRLFWLSINHLNLEANQQLSLIYSVYKQLNKKAPKYQELV